MHMVFYRSSSCLFTQVRIPFTIMIHLTKPKLMIKIESKAFLRSMNTQIEYSLSSKACDIDSIRSVIASYVDNLFQNPYWWHDKILCLSWKEKSLEQKAFSNIFENWGRNRPVIAKSFKFTYFKYWYYSVYFHKVKKFPIC